MSNLNRPLKLAEFEPPDQGTVNIAFLLFVFWKWQQAFFNILSEPTELAKKVPMSQFRRFTALLFTARIDPHQTTLLCTQMTLTSALTFFIAIFIFGITPGPGIFAIIGRALSQGARACTALAFGMAVSDVIYLVLACFSLSAIAENYGNLFTLIRYAGAAYLIFLGWKLWTTPAPTDTSDTLVKRSGTGASLLQGMAISASNPKVILFYIAFLPSFIDLTRLSHTDIALAALITIVALMSALMAIAWGAARARKLARSSKSMQRLNRTAGSIMIGAGTLLAIKS